MSWTRMLILVTLPTIIVIALAGCGGAPTATAPTAALPPAAPPNAPTAPPALSTASAASDAALMATVAAAPTGAPAPTAATTAPAATSAALTATNPAKPDDTTQGRLRVSNCVMGGPSVDVFVNGKLAVNGDLAQANLAALDASGYLYLAPATYSVALVPTGKGIDQALLGPLDLPIVAGHRYTLAMLGLADQKQHTPLVIDETEAYQKAGVSPDTWGEIVINNVKGSRGISFVMDSAGPQNVPYGAFAAAAIPAGPFKDFKILIDSETVENNGAGFNMPAVDQLDCFSGTYPGPHDTHTAFYTSALNTVDFLQIQSKMGATSGSGLPSFSTFLAALKTTGLEDMLTTGDPYLVFAPTDEAFAALPKDKLDALLADPKALAELVRNHIVEGYYPYGSLSAAPGLRGPDRTVTNMLGKPLRLLYTTINGMEIGENAGVLVANGTRINIVSKLLTDVK